MVETAPPAVAHPAVAYPAVALRGIVKAFGSVRANDGATLEAARGQITGVVGENGAGKSTLMAILAGLVAPDAGEIRIDDRPMRPRSARDALARGVGLVHQHFRLVDPFTALENVVLGAEGGGRLGPGLAAGRASLERLMGAYGLAVDLDVPVGRLAVGARQRVELLKVLHRGARILVLDEPTAVLTPGETDGLFRLLRALADDGAAILLVTHKLREVMSVTDAVHVMRAGRVVASRRTPDTGMDELAELMIGRRPHAPARPEANPGAAPGAERLVAAGLGARGSGGEALLSGVDLTLRAGEIVGVAGVSGNGQDVLLEVLAGIRPPCAGAFAVGGRTVSADRPADPRALRRLGVAHVPEDRGRAGIVAAFSAAENAVLGRHDRPPATRPGLLPGVLDPAAIRGRCAALMARHDVRPPRPELPLGGFSGGNQQKLVMARELEAGALVLLIGQPTRGVDVGAVARIREGLLAARAAGAAILLVSADLDEVLALADRIVVMAGGRIAGELAADEADARRLGALMGGLAEGPAGRPGGRPPAGGGDGPAGRVGAGPAAD